MQEEFLFFFLCLFLWVVSHLLLRQGLP